MTLKFNIKNCVAWAPGLESAQDWKAWQEGVENLPSKLSLPKLLSIPPMQRRRLSPYAKVALHCALEASGEHQSDVACVFSSRHGDLHRTTGLIENVAQGQDLSPTQFGLSVHNAAAGLFSIFAGNRSPFSAIAAGSSSFLVGLIDSLAKLHTNNLSRILYVYCDLKVPECYRPYVDDDTSIGIGILIEKAHADHAEFSLCTTQTELPETEGPQAYDFMQYMLGHNLKWLSRINQQSWLLQRNSHTSS